MASFDIDAELIRKLAALLAETGLNEIEFAQGEQRIRVMRGAAPVAAALPAAPAAASEPALAGDVPAAAGAPRGAVVAPMVGTAYLSPEPNAPPFVKVGDSVSVGQTLLIVEAMKVMNPIRAPHAGTVRRILISDAQPIEFGEVLMIID